MKKIHTVLCLAALLLAACGGPEKKTVSFSGTIQGLGNDTLYLYGTDRLYNRLDTLFVTGDKLSGEIAVDTLTTACKAAPLSDEALEDSATAFIRNNLTSPACLYVLDEYFVRKPSPDLQALKALIEDMTGELKERLYIEHLLDQIETAEKIQKGRTAPHFELPDAEGKSIRRTDFKDKYLLLYFWASWDEACKESNRMLRQLYKDKKSREHFDILGIALDTDKRQWQEAIAQDTLEWKQACDFKGWNSGVVNQFAIRTLPTHILLTPMGRIEGQDLTKEQLEEKLKEIVQEKNKKRK